MAQKRWFSLLSIAISTAMSLIWGISLGRSIPGGTNDLQVIYYGAGCLMQHGDPYRLDQLRAFYAAKDKRLPPGSIERPQAVTWYIYLPPTFLIGAPLAMLPWTVAEAVWIAFLAGAIALAALLMINEAAHSAPRTALVLACLVLMNCEIGFALGNAAVLVVSLSTIAAWCFLRERFVGFGIVALALALALKPHDAVLVWLYFVIAGGANRKRAMQSMAITAIAGLVAVVWVTQVAPHWLQEWNANVSALTVRGGLSDPGLSAEKGRSAGEVIDLQASLSVIKDDPRFYDPVSHVICGSIFLVWFVKTIRGRLSQVVAWHSFAVLVPLTLLATYHRPYDAKLLLLTIPPCAMLVREGGRRGWCGLAATTAAILCTADLPLTILSELTARADVSKMSLFERIGMVPVMRPAPLALLASAVFYLWIYARYVRHEAPAPVGDRLRVQG